MLHDNPYGARFLVVALLGMTVAGVVVAHWPVLSARALFLDDHQYVTVNPLVQNPGWTSAGRFFREVLQPSTVAGYYHPLAMVSLMLDCATGGRTGHLRPFHRTSLALHVANTVLVLVFLYLLFRQPWAVALAALLFGVHPMTVETVAWVTERKTLLATFFTLACLILYVGYVRKGSRPAYAGALAAFVLALLSKPTSTPLPLLLLLLDFWPLRRLNRGTIVEKIPFLVLAAVSAVITFISQSRAASVVMPERYSPFWIPLTICHNIVYYLRAFLWPFDLTPHHAFPEPFDLSQPVLRVGVIGTVILIPLMLISLRWTRAVLAGWLFFFLAIFPTMGVIGFTHVIAAEKYAYLPILGFLLVITSFLTRLWKAQPRPATLTMRRVGAVVAVLLIGALSAGQTRAYLRHWQDTQELYRYALTKAPHAATLHINLGLELADQRQFAEAIAHYNEALRRNANSHHAHANLASALVAQGRFADAVPHFEAALRLKPDLAAVYNNFGSALAMQGRLDEAAANLEKALRLNPAQADAHSNLGNILAYRGRHEPAIVHFREALRLKPDLPEAHINLGRSLAAVGEFAQAEQHLRTAVRLRSDALEAYRQLGSVLAAQGKLAEAVTVYEAALRLAPDDAALPESLQQVRARLAAPDQP